MARPLPRDPFALLLETDGPAGTGTEPHTSNLRLIAQALARKLPCFGIQPPSAADSDEVLRLALDGERAALVGAAMERAEHVVVFLGGRTSGAFDDLTLSARLDCAHKTLVVHANWASSARGQSAPSSPSYDAPWETLLAHFAHHFDEANVALDVQWFADWIVGGQL